MNYILFDDHRNNLLPLTYTRPVADLRWGILTIREKWDRELNASCSYLTEAYLSEKYPLITTDNNVYINGSICPDDALIAAIHALENGQCLSQGENLIAARSNQALDFEGLSSVDWEAVPYAETLTQLTELWHIFQQNGTAIETDFERLTAGRSSAKLSETNTLIGDRIFIEEGASVEAAILNATSGPIYIGKGATVMEGSIVRGPFALCDYATLKLGAKIYGPTTVGPHSKVGGEVNNSVIIGYSNKGHDGFLGNSVIGEWCNLGADTNTSNLKNNYAEVKIWNYDVARFRSTGQQFCGLMMGDHSKCGINTMFNTGTVVGVSANIFGAGFPRNFVPSFAWGGAGKWILYRFDKAMEVAEIVMARRNVDLTEADRKILQEVFQQSEQYRNF